MKLNTAHTQTELWQMLEAHMGARLADQRTRAEKLGITHEERMAHVIRIDEIKKFLALGTPEPKPERTRV
jgi:hypothetical protein